MILDDAIAIRQKMTASSADQFCCKGIIQLSTIEIGQINFLKENKIVEVFDLKTSLEIHDNISAYLGKDIKIELRIGNIENYYETLDQFYKGNKLECANDFYIYEMNYRENHNKNEQLENYKNNLQIINLLKDICTFPKIVGDEMELFFYKFGNGVILNIEYLQSDLVSHDTNTITRLKTEVLDPNNDDKKQLFINELINYLEKNTSFANLLQNWESLIDSYYKSYSLYLEGFSFEKIKTSSTEHFQKLADKISESIGKASTYIFGVPVGYILLLNSFDFTGFQIGKNATLLLLGSIFFVLIWFVLFKNISESIDIIKSEINDFASKIESTNTLNEIHLKLQSLRDDDLESQRRKLTLVKALTTLIYLILLSVAAYTFIGISLFYI